MNTVVTLCDEETSGTTSPVQVTFSNAEGESLTFTFRDSFSQAGGYYREVFNTRDIGTVVCNNIIYIFPHNYTFFLKIGI